MTNAETAGKTRRKSGEGSIRSYETTSGLRWLIVYGVRDPETGARRQKMLRGFPNERAALKALRERVVSVDKGQHVEPSKQPLRLYLESWAEGLRLSPQTISSYRRNLRLHVTPRLGAVPLANLTGPAITAVYTDMLRAGHRGKPLSPRTVRYVHTILRKALQDAVDADLLLRNPADKARPPRAKDAKAPEMHCWTGEQLAGFLAWSRGRADEHYPLWHLAAMTGMRRGELLALRWADLDLTAGAVSVRRSVGVLKERGEARRYVFGGTKTDRPRVVDLDAETVAVLRAHRSAAAGVGLLRVKDTALVFSTPNGDVCDPERISEAFDRRVRACPAVPRIRFHDVRHTAATLMLAAGENVKVVSERLGHADAVITLQVYAHVLPGQQRAAAERLAALIQGAGA